MSIICPYCKSPVEDGSLFCTNCGKPLNGEKDIYTENICPCCGAELEEGATICLNCGNSVVNQKQCPNCGEYVDEDNVFCTNCGYEFNSNSNVDNNQKQCPECGEYVDKDSDFCIFCSHSFVNTPEDIETDNSVEKPHLIVNIISKESCSPEVEIAKSNFKPASFD